MTSPTSAPRSFTAPAKFFHWLMAAIWIAAWFVGFVAVHWREALNPHHGLTFWHKAIASTILFLFVLRLAWRLTHSPPSLPSNMSPFMKRAAHAGHFVLYAFALLALPVSGWYWSSVAGQPIMVAGLFKLFYLRSADSSLYPLAHYIHRTLAWGMGIIVLGHVAAALKHHLVDKDDTLMKMLPGHGKK